MDLSTQELVKAKEAVAALLEALRIDAYLFDVEPGDPCRVRIECAVPDGWQTIDLTVESERLLAGPREALLQEWRPRLAACRTR